MRFAELVEDRLRALDASDQRRALVEISGVQGARVVLEGASLLQLSSNDYLGLAGAPTLRAALAEGAQRWGAGAAASRLITGHMTPHRAAEEALAAYVRASSALLFSSGYAANVGALQALVGPDDLVFSDALNHASLIDGCRLSRARVEVYRHRDVDHLEALLAAHRGTARGALIVTDALFSMDGHAAPLRALRALANRWDAGLLVDEAHALGVVGPEGRGLAARDGIVPDVLVGTLGKAAGLAGAFVAGDDRVRDLVLNRARSFVFSTGMSPALAHAIPTAVACLEAADDARSRLERAASGLRADLRALGFDARGELGPILPVWIGDAATTLACAGALLERGVLVRGIRPPTVPPGTSRLRVVPTAVHTDEDLARVLDAFAGLPKPAA